MSMDVKRRSLLKTLSLGFGATALAPSIRLKAALPKMKIKRIRYYQVTGDTRPIFNQSSQVVTIETDQGLTGIGEGGHKDSIEQLAGLIIGEDPTRIEHLWQIMYRHYFYPPGREKVHALGALDLALWDLKGKALGVPVYDLLGGLTRDFVECYATGFPQQGSLEETARACMEFGYRAFRFHGAEPETGKGFESRKIVDATHHLCEEIRKGVGKDGDWAIDFHTRFDLPDAVRLCGLIEPLNPAVCGGSGSIGESGSVPNAKADGESATGGGRTLWRPMGCQHAHRKPTLRLFAGDSAQLRWHYGVHEIGRDLRNALRWPYPAFHRSDRRGGAGSLPGSVVGSIHHGDERQRRS